MIELHGISVLVGALFGAIGALSASLLLNMPKKQEAQEMTKHTPGPWKVIKHIHHSSY